MKMSRIDCFDHLSYSYCIAPMIDLLESNIYALLIKSKFNIDKSSGHFQTQQSRLYIKSHADMKKIRRQNKVNGIKETCSQPAYSCGR